MTDTTHRPRLMTRPRIGVLLPNFDAVGSGQPLPIVAAARLAEELGFDAAWVGDHLACPAPGLDAPSCLAAAAAVTERHPPRPQRHAARACAPPAWAAKIWPTIDHLSGGRLRARRRASAASSRRSSRPPAFRCASAARALDDALQVIRDLLTRPARRLRGADARTSTRRRCEPAMAAPPPIYVGGRGEAALRAGGPLRRHVAADVARPRDAVAERTRAAGRAGRARGPPPPAAPRC